MTATLSSPLIEIAADPVALYELSIEQGWGDGVPLLPPTDERVQALLATTPLAADHVLGSRDSWCRSGTRSA
jgi:hypothetical protein